MNATEFIAVWRRWDAVCARMPRRPSARYGEPEARRMEDACHAMAGGRVSAFRERLARSRRAGLSCEDALADALSEAAS